MPLTITDLSDEIERTARSLARQWPGIEVDDIEQEMTLKVLDNWTAITDSDNPERVALGLAYRRGQQYCSQERTEYQINSAQWIYTPTEIRILLPSLFDGLAWEDAPKRPSKGKEYLEADGISVLMMDIRQAFEAIAEQHQAIILSVFRDGTLTTTATERKRVSRAVDAMTAVLNRTVMASQDAEHEGPGARSAVSNAQARYRTANDY